MDSILFAIRSEFSDLPSLEVGTRLVLRLFMAGALGGVLGYERERQGKSAGLRTHVLLSMGTAFFVMVPALYGMQEEALSRVLQGVLAGVGFLGAGTIMKHENEGRIEGLTTSAGLWFTAAIGVAAGMGRELSAIIGSAVGLIILGVFPAVTKLSPKKPTRSLILDDTRSETG